MILNTQNVKTKSTERKRSILESLYKYRGFGVGLLIENLRYSIGRFTIYLFDHQAYTISLREVVFRYKKSVWAKNSPNQFKNFSCHQF